jgi:RNA polymerase sigma factor (sigma-70 family)
MRPDTAEIAELVTGCRNGHSAAFGPLVQLFQNAGYAIAVSMVHDAHDAEDLLQDAFVSAYCKLGQLSDPAAFPGWFRSIVVAQCRDWLRQRGVRQRYAEDARTRGLADGGAARPHQEERLAQQHIWKQVFALAEPNRSAALLHYLSGFSQREIAAFLQVPQSTVNGRLQQARKALRRTLSPAELEDVPMSRIDVSTEVADAVYQIATEPVHERIAMDGLNNVVVYCGVNADIAVERASGDELVIEGSRISMGLSDEEAHTSARCTRIHSDRVEDFSVSGPHPGEVFAGTNLREEGPETSTRQTTEIWEAYSHGTGAGVSGLTPAGLYPHLSDRFMPFPEALRDAMRQAVRVSVVQDEAQVLTLPPDAYRPRLQKVFRPNANTPEWVHGPVGYVSLSVGVPAGKCLTILRADQVDVRDVDGAVHLVQCSMADIQGVEGNVCLVDTPATLLCRINGDLLHRWYSFGGMNWDDETLRAKRWRQYSCRVEDVSGGVDLDVARMDLELARLGGTVKVMNRYGDTRFHVAEWTQGSRCRLESVSGSVRLFLKEELIPDLPLTVLTLCGSIGFGPYRELDKGQANSTQVASFSTIPPTGKSWTDAADADLLVKTECGDVEIEQVI